MASRTEPCVTGCVQSKGGEKRTQPVAYRQANRVQMVLQAERCKEVSLDIDVALEISFGQTQGIAPEDHRSNKSGVVAHQGERRVECVRGRIAESQGGAVPQTQRETAIEAAEQALQQVRCFVSVTMRYGSRLVPRRQAARTPQIAHAEAPAATFATATGGPGDLGVLMSASLPRWSISALMATTAKLPDIDTDAIFGDSVNG